MYKVNTDRLKDDMVSAVLKEMRQYVMEENYEIQQRYDNIVMLCHQCFMYQDNSMMDNLKTMIYELDDDLREGYGIREHSRYEYIIRENSRISEEMLLVALSRRYETANIDLNLDAEIIVLFRQIWLSGKTTPAVITALGEFVARCDTFMMTLVTYAMMLRCVRYYDRAMTRLLMDMRTPESFVALAVIMMTNAQRIAHDRSQRDMFARFCADAVCLSRLTDAVGMLYRSNETNVIAAEFEKNIYPEVLKKRSDLNISEIIDKGKNPDWEALLGGSPLMDKMRKINDMQLKGKDVNFATFRAMKGYPFFSDTAHWFYPFTMGYREMGSMKGMDEKGVELLSRVANLCDSDRYSLFLMFRSMGIQNMEAALGNFGVDKINDLKDMVDDNLKGADEVRFGLRLRYSVMNIFRFYRLAPNHSDFTSPFKEGTGKKALESINGLFTPETIMTLANAAFAGKDYLTAFNLYYMSVDRVVETDVHIYQKMGYCNERLERYLTAIDFYDKSDILLPDDLWTLRRLAECHKSAHSSTIVLMRLYKRILALAPEDFDVAIELAEIQSTYNLDAEAVPLLYRLEYSNPCYRVWALLSTSLASLGKYGDAANFFEKACNATDAEPKMFIYAALNRVLNDDGEYESLLRESYGILNDTDQFISIFEEYSYVSDLMSRFTQQQRDKFKNTINKIIIES